MSRLAARFVMAYLLVLPVSIPFALFTIWVTGRTLNLWSALGILLLFLQVEHARHHEP